MSSLIRRVLSCLCLAAALWPMPVLAQTPLKTLIAERGVVLLEFDLEEWGLGGRKGPLRVYSMPPETNPWAGGNFLDPSEFPPVAAALTTQVDSICGSNVALAGGTSGGWIFGPYLPNDPTRALADIRSYLPSAREGTVAYVVLIGTWMPDGNWAENQLCGGSTDPVEYGLQVAFIYPTSTLLDSGHYHIGELYYASEIGENWYRLYSGTPFGPVTGAQSLVPSGPAAETLGAPQRSHALQRLAEHLQARRAGLR